MTNANGRSTNDDTNKRPDSHVPDASEDDETTLDEGNDGGDDVDDAGDDSGDAEYVPPTRDEWQRTQDALKRANADAKKHRLRARDLEKGKPGEGEDAKAVAAAEAAEARYKPVAVRATARAAFMEAGLNDATPERVRKLLRLIDMEGVDVDEDGDVVGLDDQIDSIKADYPELFIKPEEKARTRTPRVDGANKAGAPVKKSSADILAAALTGK